MDLHHVSCLGSHQVCRRLRVDPPHHRRLLAGGGGAERGTEEVAAEVCHQLLQATAPGFQGSLSN